MLSRSSIGKPGSEQGTRLILLGSGELGREVTIEAQRLGCEVLAVDRYDGAPAHQVADRYAVIDMTDPVQLRNLIEAELLRPCAKLLVVPEIEAIVTSELALLEAEGVHVVPTARATVLTMDREGIRRLAAEQLGLSTSPYRFCDSEQELAAAVEEVGVPCVVKPVMSSSGKGQSVVRELSGAQAAWTYSQEQGRTGAGRVICEGFVDFDYEITLLTVRHAGGTSFCAPIGHIQVDGDYRESWQPQQMTDAALAQAKQVAQSVTDELGGYGLFGVELFVRGDEILFSEVSPRPHDTGMVTMATQSLSEFAIHARAILSLPVPAGDIPLGSPGASCVVLADADISNPVIHGVDEALGSADGLDVRIFNKPDARPGRRMGVVLATAGDPDTARDIARAAAAKITVSAG
ncbi:MAG: formate-dependent phosphoribosylglycinamide formyltransferase [Actinomycetes bacterium]